MSSPKFNQQSEADDFLNAHEQRLAQASDQSIEWSGGPMITLPGTLLNGPDSCPNGIMLLKIMTEDQQFISEVITDPRDLQMLLNAARRWKEDNQA